MNQPIQLVPQEDLVLDHLSHIVRRWSELGEDCLFELRFLTDDDPAIIKDISRFRSDRDGIQQACAHIAAMNPHHLNAYVVVNPIDATADIKAGKGAKDEHILASFFQWADSDDAQAASNIRAFVGPRPTFYVLTGSTPCQRPHVYWELEEPTRNLRAWTETQKAIAATLGTDPAVINPSRIMRVGGTINWPSPKKVAKGYTREVTTLHIHSSDDRPFVSSERMARAFTSLTTAPVDRTFPEVGHQRKTSDDYADILRRARTDGEKHGGVRDLSASLAGSGVSKEMATAIVKEICPVDDDGVVKLIDSAFEKFAPAPKDEQFVELSVEEKAGIAAAPFKPWVRKDLAAIPSPQFVYSDFYARKYTSVTLAAPKVGKSMLGLAEAVDMASGTGLLTGTLAPRLKVVYYNAEDDQDVIDNRVAALLMAYGLEQSAIEGWLFPQSGVEHDSFYLVSGQEGVINEALFVSIEKFIRENDADVLIFDPLQDLSRSPETNEVFRLLGARLRRLASTSGVALGLVHHTRKVTPGMTPTIDDMRGGSALRGTARFNRILIGMTENEAAQSGVENHKYFLRIGDVESNLAPPSSEVNRWYKKASIQTPSGAYVGAIKPWAWPNAFDGLTNKDAARVRSQIEGMAIPPRADVRSAQWVGHTIGAVLGIDADSKPGKAKIKGLVSGWIKSDVLRVSEGHDKRSGREVRIVVCGANNPMAVSGE